MSNLINITIIYKFIYTIFKGDKMDNKINELKEYPQLGPVWYLENNIDSGFRFLRYENYILFYQITKDVILIVRVLHHLQDYVKQLF